MPRQVPTIAVKFVEREEGRQKLRPDGRFGAYKDPGGVWTCGTGSTTGVTSETIWTADEVDAALERDMATSAFRVQSALGPKVVAGLNDHQYAALLSFVFNEGERLSWTIWKDIRAGDLDMVPSQLRMFDLIKGVKSAGLDNRRDAEINLWQSKDPLCRVYPLADAAPLIPNGVKDMSWLSRAENAFINLVTGKKADTNVILNPKTPVENAINGAASIVLPIAASIPGASATVIPLTAVQAVVNGAEGKPGHPDAGAAVASLTTTIGTEAATTANQFLITKIGTTNTAMADAGLEGLATAALALMSQSSNKPVEDIAAELHAFINGFAAGSVQTPAKP